MPAHERPPADLNTLRTAAATLLAAATAAALANDDRLTEARTEINRTAPHGIRQPGHTDLVRREATYRLAHAARLDPPGLLTPNIAEALANRDRAWPRPIRRTALLAATAHLPATPGPIPSPPTPPSVPTITTAQLTTTFHAAARHAATHLRSARTRTLAHALATAAHEAARDLPNGYGLLLERELILRLALTLALPATGALAPGLDTALAHATRAATRTELADLILTAARPTATRTAAPVAQVSRVRFVPRQRGRTGTCPCVCSTGGFCGGCGHADCGRR
ncbi:hypothetical protein [Kitasatospora sp. NBC_01266]|uniref:hypothetical protein n=1 Tax=Kitasatospora sp. NBC_01266 TaxID=2903572 RepID=UPI002E2FC5B9|nr:hypothetical protein [Kitasatospora sp. NBC_01266]